LIANSATIFGEIKFIYIKQPLLINCANIKQQWIAWTAQWSELVEASMEG